MTRSTIRRSEPTIVTARTGKDFSASSSTAFCACRYVPYVATVSPVGSVGVVGVLPDDENDIPRSSPTRHRGARAHDRPSPAHGPPGA